MGPTVGSNQLQCIQFDADAAAMQACPDVRMERWNRLVRVRSRFLITALLLLTTGIAWPSRKNMLHQGSRLSFYQAMVVRELQKTLAPGDGIAVGFHKKYFDTRRLQKHTSASMLLAKYSAIGFDSVLGDGAAVIAAYREPSLWDRYHWFFAIGGVVIAFQTILIFTLAIEGRKRKESEKSTRELAGRLIHAQEKERRRIAGELHDDVSQRLALVCLQLDMMRGSPPSSTEVLVRELSLLYNETDMISSDIHQFSRELHPAILERLGLVSALRRYSSEFTSHRKIDVDMQILGEQITLNHETALALFRVGQESLMNIAKHSGAISCSVRLNYTPHRVTLEVKDNGKGFERKELQEKSGLGVESMRERLRSVGGELHIDSTPSQGTKVKAEVAVMRGAANKIHALGGAKEEQPGLAAG